MTSSGASRVDLRGDSEVVPRPSFPKRLIKREIKMFVTKLPVPSKCKKEISSKNEQLTFTSYKQ
jgi:hypothetical protein